MVRVLVTGATGMVGRGLLERAAGRKDLRLLAGVRGPVVREGLEGTEVVVLGDLGRTEPFPLDGLGIDVVVHAAARAHVMRDTAATPLEAFRAVNVAGTRRLALRAAEVGAKRFVFLSTIKVHGEETLPGRPFRADDEPRPVDAYGASKLEAEESLREVAAATGLEVVIVRPPLVYGPGVKANFARLARCVLGGLPLPLGSLNANRRSLVGLDNLADLLLTCLDHPAAANRTFLVSDGEDLSTAELLRRLGRALGKPARLVPVPAVLLRMGGAGLGRADEVQRLVGSLQADMEATRDTLGWVPPVSVDQGLERTAQWLLSSRRR